MTVTTGRQRSRSQLITITCTYLICLIYFIIYIICPASAYNNQAVRNLSRLFGLENHIRTFDIYLILDNVVCIYFYKIISKAIKNIDFVNTLLWLCPIVCMIQLFTHSLIYSCLTMDPFFIYIVVLMLLSIRSFFNLYYNLLLFINNNYMFTNQLLLCHIRISLSYILYMCITVIFNKLTLCFVPGLQIDVHPCASLLVSKLSHTHKLPPHLPNTSFLVVQELNRYFITIHDPG
jgi:hypothetical protein